MVKPSDDLLDRLVNSGEYAEYIMNNCHGERVIGNGHALISAMEDSYLWEEFLASKGISINDFD